jgi:hypothetical protein
MQMMSGSHPQENQPLAEDCLVDTDDAKFREQVTKVL